MIDIVERLRCWVVATDAVPASDLMDEAADEIARLRLTDAEREAIECFARWKWNTNGIEYYAATLRALLERMK
jgi:hypothetical protein